MTPPLLHRLGPLAGLGLFLLALWVLHQQLAEYNYGDMIDYLDQLPWSNLGAAMLLTCASYAVITMYDLLAMRYLRKPLPIGKVMFASFLSYAFSNTIGLSVLSSASVRLRLYSGWGLSALEIARLVIFSAITLWLGLLVTASGVLIVKPVELPDLLHLPIQHSRTLGWLLLTPVIVYLLLAHFRRQPLRIGMWELPIVRMHLALRQILIGSVDWLLAATVLYVLLPKAEELGFVHFLAVFLSAQIAALISHVPGGMGVFEAVVLLMFEPWLDASDLLGGLLAFRLIYYFVPLLLAAIALAVYESAPLRRRLSTVSDTFSPVVSALLPSALALVTFAGGALLLLSTVSPAADGRLEWMSRFIPLSLLELSHFLGAVIAMALILLAQGLQRRLDAAWLFTFLLLLGGSVTALLKGGDYEEASVLALLALILLPCRAQFYRQSSLFAERFSPGWLLAIAMVCAAAIWFGFFSFKEVDYSSDLWWQFTFDDEGEAPRFLRSLLAIGGGAMLVATRHLLQPAPPARTAADATTLAQLPARLASCPQTYAHLARVGDKAILYSTTGTGFLMYTVQGRAWIAMGDPLGTPAECRELAWRLRELADEHAGWTVFYQVSPQQLDIYVELGLSLLKIGEEARVELARFNLDGASRKTLRNTRSRLQRDGYSFHIVEPADVTALLPQLRAVSDEWLSSKQTREKRFSVGCFEERYLCGNPIAVISHGDEIIAFANLWCGADRRELSVDLMRFVHTAPNGTMDFLFTELLLWGKSNGYEWFNLGMAPLAGLHSRALAPLWNRFGAMVFGYGEHFYNFRGVRQYKEKFGPIWEPRYLATPGGLRVPRILAALATLIAGGLGGVVRK